MGSTQEVPRLWGLLGRKLCRKCRIIYKIHPAGLWRHAQGPTVDEVEFEVFKLLNSMLDEVLSVQEEPASLEGVVLTNCHTGAWS